MPKRTSAADSTLRVVIITLDAHLGSAAERAGRILANEVPGLTLTLHAASEWGSDESALERCRQDIARGDIIVATMLFLDEHIQAVLPDLQARRNHCDALVGLMSAGEVARLTRMGRFDLSRKEAGALAWLKKLRGSRQKNKTVGAQQMAMLRRIPRLLRFIPGTAQDVRAYFIAMQYWLASSDQNLTNLVRHLVNRYASGPLRGSLRVQDPVEYPEVGVYHPRLRQRVASDAGRLPGLKGKPRGRVGLLIMRSYVLAGNTAHYDGVIASLENRGIEVVPAFASGLDARPAVDAYFVRDGKPAVDAVVSLTGFSLVGGPAYNDSRAAEEMLAALDVPYLAAQAIEFQSLEEWDASDRGLTPVEATMMVAIPEIDGATGSMIYGGRSDQTPGSRDMTVHTERAEMLASRVDRLIQLRQSSVSQRRVAIVLFNFPPNSGNAGTAAHLNVFASLHNVLRAMAGQGYQVEGLPDSVEELRAGILEGNAQQLGADANVCARIPVGDYVRSQPWLDEIEKQWGPAPGRQQSDGESIWVLGRQFGNVLVAVQPAFGYEGDPMRLLFESGFAPTHATAAFYRYLREDFGANACLHFGTHGSLEFMPGKQTGLSDHCWPDRLIGDLPNIYVYAANNPSEGTIAKRRSAATLVSYLTPSVTQAGVYNKLSDLKGSLQRWRGLLPDERDGHQDLLELIRVEARELELAEVGELDDRDADLSALWEAVRELENTLIPHGLHVIGEPMDRAQRSDLLNAMNQTGDALPDSAIGSLVEGESPDLGPDHADRVVELSTVNKRLSQDSEIPAILHALDGGYTRPAPGGDLLRNPEVLPTGRNVHSFDPFRIPSAYAVTDGARQAQLLLDRHAEDGNGVPETVALVLWGTDNLKSEGGPISQALALLGARPRHDSYGRLCGAELVPLAELGRPRIDVVLSLSGIFRDLLPLQTRMLAEACYLAAAADEPADQNFVRAHALAFQQEHQCDLETAALRVFSNADGAYGSNVNHLVDSGAWNDEDELAETYSRRKCFAYGVSGSPVKQPELLASAMANVQLAYQNLESVELGVTTVDHYFDTLGGISRAVSRARGSDVPVYIGDQTQNNARVRTLKEQVALETRTRMLNPKWYEGMLDHGHEGVRQIATQVTNTMGWSATTGHVDPWVYQQITQTYILEDGLRQRLAELNPQASAKLANRLLEAHERDYWSPDEATLAALREAGDEFEDRIEGITNGVAA